MTLNPGTKLGPYEVLGAIGAGGMGEVYRAKDTRLGRDVAIKVLPESFARDEDRLRRFEQEARAVAALNHPNILAVYDVGEFNGSPYLVSELLDGETLREEIGEGPLPQRRAVEYASQIADGLAAAHDKGIVHRDLKPENVFVTRDGRIKILDFGLAKLARAESAAASMADTRGPTVTTPGVALGTAGYMSPEQVRGKDVDARTDIFAFGAILYEMLSGQRAFRGDTSVETMNAILKEEPPELEVEKLRVSPGLERLVRRCLEKEPQRRFQSARDLGFALEAVSGSHVTAAERVQVKAKKPVAAKLAVVAALLAIGAGAYWAGTRSAAGEKAVEDQFRLLTFQPQIIFRAAFAPDGKTVIFSSAHWANRPDIFVLSPEYPEPRATELKNTQLLAVSSKGELAVLTQPQFLGHRIFHGTLARVPIGGSAPRAILDGVMEADWSPDGTELAITRLVGSRCRLEYPIGKILAETNGYFSDLRISPKGDRIAFFEHEFRYDDRGTVAVVDTAGAKQTLSEMFWGAEGLAWSADGKEILYSAGKGSYSSFPVRAVDLQGRTRIVQDSAGGLWIMDVNRDGKWLALQEGQWREMGGLGPGAKSEVNLSFLDFSEPITMSKDGKTLLFTEENSFFGKNYSALIRKTDGSAAFQIGEGQAADLSPDGTLAVAILFTSPDKLMVYPTGAGASRQLNTGKVHNIQSAKWFPDGKSIAICGSELGHSTRCYLVSLAGGEPVPVTPEGTTTGLPSPDGKDILALNGDGTRSLYPVSGGSPRMVSVLGKQQQGWWDDLIGWTVDRKGFIVRVAESEAVVTLHRIDLETGKRTLLRRLAPADTLGLLAIQNIVVAEDAKYYAYAYRRERSSLFLVNREK